jgi:KaiC/GvpD/RAD55 family RecA-like ATPase
LTVQNSEFLAYVYGDLGQAFGWTTSFRADPNAADPTMWEGKAWRATDAQKRLIDAREADNNFYCVASMSGREIKRRKAHFERLCVLVADDATLDGLAAHPTYIIETSPGKYQIGCIIDATDPDARNAALIDKVMQVMASEGLVGADASGNNLIRYVRLPQGANTKKRPSGAFSARLLQFDAERVYSLEDACMVFGIDLDRLRSETVVPLRRELKPRTNAAQLIEALVTPDLSERSYHDPLLKLTAKLASEGVKPDTTVEVVTGIMQAGRPADGPELRRWEARVQEIPRLVKGAVEKFAPEPVKPFEPSGLIRTANDVGREFEDIDWIVDELIPEQAVGMIFGASGTFKSFIAIDLCCHIANGMEFIAKETRKAPVLYLASEGGAGIYRRIQAWHKHHGLPISDDVWLVTTPLILTVKEQLEALITAMEAMTVKPAFVVIDTLSQTFAGDENSSNDIASYIRAINTDIRARFGCSVAVIHHTGHNASDRPRGSSAMMANLDYLLGVFKPDPEASTARMMVVKQKDGDRLDDMYFTMEREDLGVTKKGKPASSLVSVYNDALRAAGGKTSKYDLVIMNLLESGKIVSEDEMRNAIKDEAGCSADTARQGVRRSLIKLVNSGYVRRAGSDAWKKA